MYDLIIVGAGPAGLSAAIYAARYRLKTLVIGEIIGGLILDAYKVCNYPGFKEISGIELMKKFEEQVKELKVQIKEEEVTNINKQKDKFFITTKKNKYESKTIILALGTKRRKLNIPGEENFVGKGISYCATCDAALFKEGVVGVVGGSNAAAMTAELLAEYAKKVYIIYRKEKMRAEPLVVERLEKNKKIEIVYNANVKKINGDNFIKSIELDTGKELKLDGLFIEIGAVPALAITKGLNLKTDKEGYIVVDREQSTGVEGVYAAGDISNNSLKQVVTATAEGSVAAFSAYLHLKER